MERDTYHEHFDNSAFILKALMIFVGGGIALFSAFLSQTLNGLIQKGHITVNATLFLSTAKNIYNMWIYALILLGITYFFSYLANRFYLNLTITPQGENITELQNFFVACSLISGTASFIAFFIGTLQLNDLISSLLAR